MFLSLGFFFFVLLVFSFFEFWKEIEKVVKKITKSLAFFFFLERRKVQVIEKHDFFLKGKAQLINNHEYFVPFFLMETEKKNQFFLFKNRTNKSNVFFVGS